MGATNCDGSCEGGCNEVKRQDVTVTVKRLDLKNPTKEDLAAEKVIIDKLQKTMVGVLVLYAPTRDSAYFVSPITEVRNKAQAVIEQYLKMHPEVELSADEHEKVSDRFILVESAPVDQAPKVTRL